MSKPLGCRRSGRALYGRGVFPTLTHAFRIVGNDLPSTDYFAGAWVGSTLTIAYSIVTKPNATARVTACVRLSTSSISKIASK